MPMSKVITSNSWRLWVLSAVMHNSLSICSGRIHLHPFSPHELLKLFDKGPAAVFPTEQSHILIVCYIRATEDTSRHAETCNPTSNPAEQDRALPMVDCPVHVRNGLNHLPFYFMPIYCCRIPPWALCTLTRSIVPNQHGRLLWYIVWKENYSIDAKATV